MTREEVQNICLEEVNKHKCLLLNLVTGFGKSKLAIDITNKICDNIFKLYGEGANILLVVAKEVHKKNWQNEIAKWGGLKAEHLTIECYESLKKYKDRYFDVVILDECHHLSETRREVLSTITVNEVILGLSATIPNDIIDWFRSTYDTFIVSTNLQDAIEDNVLPEPTIYLIPLELKSGVPTEYIYKNPKVKGNIIECCWAMRWSCIRQKKYPVRIACNEKQYYEDLCGNIEWLKRRSIYSQTFKNKWLKLCNDRLKWLSEKKESYILSLLDKLKYQRTLTFCNSIEQTEKLGNNCIHSKAKDVEKILDRFNTKKIKHLTTCKMLDEGQNLNDCRIGIFAMINSSERINVQRLGRILRHKKPIIIIPFYKNTREEEIVKDMVEEYNPNTIKLINNINEIEL